MFMSCVLLLICAKLVEESDFPVLAVCEVCG